MKKFLEEAAEIIINNKHFGAQSVVILPNRRSEVFLKEEIKKRATSSIWLPEFYPIDEFVKKASGMEKVDNITIFFKLFKIHQKIAGSEAKTIDEFLTWAPVMLSDFNDIDNAMADAKEIFTQLSAIKAIQQWNPDGSPLTQMQKNYLHFFNSMYDYYFNLKTKLASENAGYQGLINKKVAENASSLFKKQHWNNFLIVGLNALNEAEIRILDFVVSNYKTNFIWDVDEYYFSKNAKQSNNPEAGKQIRHVINRLKIKEPENIGDNLKTLQKKIKILGVPKNIGQAKYIGQEIQKHFTGNNAKEKEKKSTLINTAVVLANEELLIPLLNSLPNPNNKKYYNVTLGYPLSNSPVEHFFKTWIDLIISIQQNNGKIKTSILISLVNNPIINDLLSYGSELVKNLVTKNISTIACDEIKVMVNSDGKNNHEFLTNLININKTDTVVTGLKKLEKALISVFSNKYNVSILTREQIHKLINITNKLIALSVDNKSVINYNAIKKIGLQLISLSTIDLIGKPLHGIQIMGMLETRNLDFENIYILSTNEGIIPKTNTVNSFIPMDIRSQRKLPLPSDNSDIYAYHFYRLLQRAKNITLVYNSDADKLGGGEKSRFILQIENELSKINPFIKLEKGIINTEILKQDVNKAESHKIIIKKNKHINNRLVEITKKGFSPSLLSNYISCPLKFYFSYVLNINTITTLEQSVMPNTFGTVVHGVLEEIYKPMHGKKIDIETLKRNLLNTRKLLSIQFKDSYNNGNLNTGKDLLIFEVANNYITNFLKSDIVYLQHHEITLLSTEVEEVVNVSRGLLNVNFKGTIDRVDTREDNETVRIIDYKTGRVTTRDLIVKNFEELATNPKYTKAFQVLFYAWLYQQQHPCNKIEAGIMSLRSKSAGFIPLVISEFENFKDCFDEFTNSVLDLVEQILDANTLFSQTEDKSRCTWCDYKTICNR